MHAHMHAQTTRTYILAGNRTHFGLVIGPIKSSAAGAGVLVRVGDVAV
jgi:hypothetical protein